MNLTCYQCHKTFSDDEDFCPHCGAVRKQNAAQAGVRLIQRFAKGALLGAIIGLGIAIIASILYIVYGHVFKNLVAGFELDTIKMFGGIGLVCGALIGGVAKIVRQLARED